MATRTSLSNASDQAETFQAGVALATDDDKIVDDQVERLGNSDDLFRNCDVNGRGCRISRKRELIIDELNKIGFSAIN